MSAFCDEENKAASRGSELLGAVLDSTGRWKEADVVAFEGDHYHLQWKEGDWGRGETKAQWFRSDDERCHVEQSDGRQPVWLGAELSDGSRAELWKRFRNQLKHVVSGADTFSAFQHCLLSGEGVFSVGDVVTFAADGGKAYIGIVEGLIQLQYNPRNPDGSWKRGAKVEALWEGKLKDNGKFKSVSEYYPGKIVSKTGPCEYHVSFDDGEQSFAVDESEIRAVCSSKSLIVRWLYRPSEASIDPSARRRLLGCKGEVLDSNHYDITDVSSVDCVQCTIDFKETLPRERGEWYKQRYDGWMHRLETWSKAGRKDSTEPLSFVCAYFYERPRRVGDVGELTPYIKRGSAAELLKSLESSEQSGELGEHVNTGGDQTEQATDKSEQREADRIQKRKVVRSAAKAEKAARKGANGETKEADKAGAGKDGAGASGKKESVTESNHGSRQENQMPLPDYAAKLPHLSKLKRDKWPSIAVAVNRATIPKLVRLDRQKRLHLLLDQYLRVYAEAQNGQEAAIRRSVDFELKTHENCLKKGVSADIYKARMSERTSQVKKMAPMMDAKEWSDGEEEVEVLDEEKAARQSMLNMLEKKQQSAEPNGQKLGKEDGAESYSEAFGDTAERVQCVQRKEEEAQTASGSAAEHVGARRLVREGEREERDAKRPHKSRGVADDWGVFTLNAAAENAFGAALALCEVELQAPSLHLAQFESLLTGRPRASAVLVTD